MVSCRLFSVGALLLLLVYCCCSCHCLCSSCLPSADSDPPEYSCTLQEQLPSLHCKWSRIGFGLYSGQCPGAQPDSGHWQNDSPRLTTYSSSLQKREAEKEKCGAQDYKQVADGSAVTCHLPPCFLPDPAVTCWSPTLSTGCMLVSCSCILCLDQAASRRAGAPIVTLSVRFFPGDRKMVFVKVIDWQWQWR